MGNVSENIKFLSRTKKNWYEPKRENQSDREWKPEGKPKSQRELARQQERS